MDSKTKRTVAASLVVIVVALSTTYTGDMCMKVFRSLGNAIFGKESILEETLYAIVFDAGSTGSRIHIFFYRKNGHVIEVDSEIYKEVKPGLSSYANDPSKKLLMEKCYSQALSSVWSKGAESILPMLDMAMEVIPASLHASTPLTLKATAGLRLLPADQAVLLLQEVKNVFKKTPFLVSEESIEIMNGDDEGIFSWISLNYLLGGFTSNEQMAAALDLGGGSTQISFLPSQQETLEETPRDYFTSINMFNKDFKLYTYSYLGNGLKSARYRMTDAKESRNLSSVCLPPEHHFVWVHNGMSYNMRGSDAGLSGFDHCRAIARSLVSGTVRRVPELQTMPVFGFAYFFDTAEELQLINGTGGAVEVGSFRKIAEDGCTNHDVRWPFVCMDSTYIYSLLHDGYGLADSTKVQIMSRIREFDVSWPLGLALQLLSSLSH